ncbi:hypothetical protein PFISCL1PPCAC_2754, partial [Pristionchus fissidentatus]
RALSRVSRISSTRLFELRRSGRIFLDRYLRDPKGFARGVLEVISKRLDLPPVAKFPINNPIVPISNEKFTVVILSYKRLDLLKKIIHKLQQVTEFVAKIIVVWNSVSLPLPEIKIPSTIEIKFIRPKKNSLNNRFLPWHNIGTDCVLSLDDDIAITKSQLLLGFKIWQSERDRIVSFVPRRRDIDANGKASYSIEKGSHYEFGLTGYALLHRNYLYEYFLSMPAAFRSFVDGRQNCEDIAMNYLVANLSRRPIISVTFDGTLNMVRNLTGLSSRSNHLVVRSDCVAFFEAAYGYNPLQSSYYQAAKHNSITK